MIKLPLIFSAFLLTAATDIVWWRSDQGTVIASRNGGVATCTLTLRGDEASLQIAWASGLPTRAVVEQRGWRFQPGNVLDIAVRIGDTWLGGGSGTPNLPAMTGPSTLMFIARDDLQTLLHQAPEVQVAGGAIQTTISVAPNKMDSLMKAVDRCRGRTNSPA